MGESYGGKYVPSYAAQTRRKFTSLVLVDAVIDLPYTFLGLYEHLCLPRHGSGLAGSEPFANSTACEEMEKAYPTCARAGDLCRSTYDAVVCESANDACFEVFKWLEMGSGARNPYDDRQVLPCDDILVCANLGQTPPNQPVLLVVMYAHFQ